MYSAVLTSTSGIKHEALKQFFDQSKINVALSTFNVDHLKLPTQPVDEGGMIAAKLRVRETKTRLPYFDWYIAVENSINTNSSTDVCNVYIEFNNESVEEKSFEFPYNQKYTDMVKGTTPHPSVPGYSVSVGDFMHKENPAIDSKNWMAMRGSNRLDQIKDGLKKAFRKLFILKEYRYFEDYPSKGVLFKDMMSVLYNKNTFKDVIDLMYEQYKDQDITCVAGLEARGFMFAPVLAYLLGASLLPIRKAGKLARKNADDIVEKEYEKEYGKDKVEMHSYAVNPDDKVLVIDDLIATGGSVKAAIEMIKSRGAEVVGVCVLRDVEGLRGLVKEVLPDVKITVLL